MKRPLYAALARIVAGIALLTPLSRPACAWKPVTHVFLANQALKDALADGKVTLYRTNYASGTLQLSNGAPIPIGEYEVDPEILRVLRAYPEKFWAGCLGPDAYPDIPTGQTNIHPPTSATGGSLPDVNLHGPADGSDAWLKYLWKKCHSPGYDSDANKAFVLGFLAHASGDCYAHTFVNYYTGGIFDLDDNALRHVTIEGAMWSRTPNLRDDINLQSILLLHARNPQSNGAHNLTNIYDWVAQEGITDGVDHFIADSLVDAGRNSELYDLICGDQKIKSPGSRFGQLRRWLTRFRDDYTAKIAEYDSRFSAQMAIVHHWEDKAEACRWNDPSCSATWDYAQASLARVAAAGISAEEDVYRLVNEPSYNYCGSWIAEIDSGVAKWPALSHRVAMALMFNPSGPGDFAEAQRQVTAFSPTLLSMATGTSSSVTSLAQPLLDWTLGMGRDIAELKGFAIDSAFTATYGSTPEQIKDAWIGPEARFDSVWAAPGAAHPAFTLAQLHQIMGLPANAPANATFDWMKFAPAYNTVTLIKLSFLKPSEVNRLIHDLGGNTVFARDVAKAGGGSMTIDTTATYNGAPVSPPNVVLGFLGSLDGGYEYRPGMNVYGRNAPGIVFARESGIYRQLFLKDVTADTRVDPLDTAVIATPAAPANLPPFTVDTPRISGYAVMRFDVTATRAANWHVEEPGGSLGPWGTLTVDADGKTCHLEMPSAVTTNVDVTLVCREQTAAAPPAPGTAPILREVRIPVNVARSLLITPANASVRSGETLHFSSNAGPGETVQIKILGLPTTPAGSALPASGNFTAPRVNAPVTLFVNAVNMSAHPSTHYTATTHVTLLPPLPPIKVETPEGGASFKAGETRRMRVAGGTGVTWRIIGDAHGASFGTPGDPAAVAAQAALTPIQTQLAQLQTMVRDRRVAPSRIKALSLPPVADLARATGGTGVSGAGVSGAGVSGGGAVSGGGISGSRITGGGISTTNATVHPPVGFASSGASNAPALSGAAAARLDINAARQSAIDNPPGPLVLAPEDTPADIRAAEDDVKRYLDDHRDTLIAQTNVLEATLSTLHAPALFVNGRVTITVEAAATDGSGRKATFALTLVGSDAGAADGSGIDKPRIDPHDGPTVDPKTPVNDEPVARNVPESDAAPTRASKSARFGNAYTVRDGALGVTILRAQYRADRFAYIRGQFGDTAIVPNARQKLLLITLRLKNVGKAPMEVGYQSVSLTADTADGAHSEPADRFYFEKDRTEQSSMLSPGASVVVQTAIVLPANAPATRLHVGYIDQDESVYDLADAGNPVILLPRSLSNDGATLLSELPAKVGAMYPSGLFDIAVLGVERSTAAFDGSRPEAGYEYIVVSVRAKNRMIGEHPLGYQTLTVDATDADGDKYTADRPYKAAAPESVTAPFARDGADGAERIVRYILPVRRGVTLKRIAIHEGEGRTYIYTEGIR